VLETPRLGCINVHASLLPRWRGAAPIQHAILAGDPETGVSIMQMDTGLDTGPVLCRAVCPIREDDTGASLHGTLAALGAVTVTQALATLADGRAHAAAQDEAMATYAGRIAKIDGLIDWSRPAQILERQVRAFNPWPVAYTSVPAASRGGGDAGQRLRIWSARVVECDSQAPPGTVLASGASGIEVAAGRDALRILTLQAPGKRAMSSGDYLNAHALTAGTVLEGAGSART
jgi:methionyl-tRNA formyltransferase